ncbi:hypothetical protein A3K69_04810 [Candidatus Bathyarchaeota archaeon RBG_16_57_9]|nr:MAG: hypothetical protein A3K69_04810 [Candidatus Bathyarchaeota archaeon RBG_16_57_9]
MNPYLGYLDVARILLALGMLGYAGVRDIRTREVHDLLWVIAGASALLLDVYELFLGSLGLYQLALAVGFMGVVGLALWFFRLMGEADILAFIVLALIHPKAPAYLGVFWGWSPVFFPFTMLSNTAVAGIVAPLLAALGNAVVRLRGVDLFERVQSLSAPRKIALLFTARYVRLEGVRGPPFQYPLEGVDGLSLRPDLWDDGAAEKTFTELKGRGYEWAWVSATLPYIVVMAAGYLLSVVFGDIIFWVLFAVL